MRMYFELDYGKAGIIGSCTCTERQTYDVTMENAHKEIRGDLAKVMKLMEKRSSVYLRIGYGEDAYTEKQVMCVSQSIGDRENEVYEIYESFEPNQTDTKKVGAGAVKRIVVGFYDGLRKNCEVLAEETKLKAEMDKEDQQEPGTAEANVIANDLEKNEDVAGDGTPYPEVLKEIQQDEATAAEKKTSKKKSEKKGGDAK